MAIEFHITADQHMFVGDDRTIAIQVFADHDATTALDVNGHNLVWLLKASHSSEHVLIEKTTDDGGITIEGTFNANPAVNLQRVLIHLEASDSYPGGSPGVSPLRSQAYRYALKRVNEGARSTLMYGNCAFLFVTTAGR